MKTYQFVVFAVVGLAIAAALVYGKKKKPCGCNQAAVGETAVEVTE